MKEQLELLDLPVYEIYIAVSENGSIGTAHSVSKEAIKTIYPPPWKIYKLTGHEEVIDESSS